MGAMLWVLVPLSMMGAGAEHPVLLGVDTAGSALSMRYGVPYWTHEPFYAALDELGASFVDVHLFPVQDSGQENSAKTRKLVEAIDAGMKAHGLRYCLNLEIANFWARAEITPGVNEFEQPAGLHFWQARMDWLEPVLEPAGEGRPFMGLLYDEAEHMQLSNNKFAGAGAVFDQPFLVNTHGMKIDQAYEALVERCREVRLGHYQGRVPLHTEQVWPDLFHIFSRAGWTVTPKLLKEGLSSAVMSIALGSALQYADQGGELWVSPDLWGLARYPGHSPEALRSALLMGYWLGADGLYVENLDYDGPEQRHPLADPKGSLLAWPDKDRYELTAHGKVVKSFFREYVPSHPRRIDWRDYRPRVAIVRLPDGGWGQFSAGEEPEPHGEAASRNRLLGNREMPLDEAASEWLYVWPILTHGAAKPGAISYLNPFIYAEGIQDFFVPIDSVAVFDHRVTGPVLDSVECFVVCGHALSKETYEAILTRASNGATVIMARRLYERHASSDTPPAGNWLIVDDFKSPTVAEKLQPFLGPADVARFRFTDETVEFRREGAADRVEVTVTNTKG